MQRPASRAAQTGSAIGGKNRAVVGADQILAAGIKKFTRLPIELERHMAAAVDVGVDLPLVAQRKSRAGLATKKHHKSKGQPAFAQGVAAAEINARFRHGVRGLGVVQKL